MSPTLSLLVWLGSAGLVLPLARAAELTLPASIPGHWQAIGRVEVRPGKDDVTIANGCVADLQALKDCQMTFRAQAPEASDKVQLWGAIRVKDRNSRYVFGLRGGVEPQISLARYAPDGNSKFLGFAPLEFAPQAGQWYQLRVAVAGTRFHIYLNDEKLPRINVDDSDALWQEGGVALGGGWLPARFTELRVTPLAAESLAAFQAVGDAVWAPPAVDHSARRTVARAAYVPARIDTLPPLRGEFPLDGNWLFMPDQDLAATPQPAAIATDDQSWHVMAVPAFWTPTLGWLHGESGLPGLKGLSANKGPSDQLLVEETDRVNAQTFDWKKTRAAWYRHHLELPRQLAGKEFHLVFDAIAKVSEVWVNGVQVGSHVGMFGQLDVDVTQALRPGPNVIAVHVVGVVNGHLKDDDKVAGIAVTVAVTNQMLRSLPHGMTDNSSGGIWQPVKLVVTHPVKVSDVFIRPALDGAQAEVEIDNSGPQQRTVELAYSISDDASHSTLIASKQPAQVKVPAHGKAVVKFATPKLTPKLWSPTTPNLYHLNLKLASGGILTDSQSTRFGFRTFAVAGGKLLLNGKPYWLRGGNHFPVTLRPNDGELARKFITLAKEGNVRITRSHSIPFTDVWFEAADELGMGVSYEGTWPWLMLVGPPPDAELLKVWKAEFAALLKQHRNHPSVLFWTVNNEMKFENIEKLGPEVLKQKWAILDDMVRTMRQIDPTRPIVADSSYTRKESDRLSKTVREANHFDDGDIDDSHRYYGTYDPSCFNFYNGEYGQKSGTPGRPLISQEMSTGYPRNDDWPSRSYQFPRYVPQAIVGDYAFEQNDPAIYLTRQAFLTKELAEVIRRTNREEANGVLHFAYLTWFTDVWKAATIKPKLTYYELKKALQPVLVSAELFGRHFYAGEWVTRRVCIANDSDDALPVPAGKLEWEIRAGTTVLSHGSLATPPVDYYTNRWLDVGFQMPAQLPAPKTPAVLALRLTGADHNLSENTYDLIVATRAWAAGDKSQAAPVQAFDPQGLATATLAGLPVTAVNSLDRLDIRQMLVIGGSDAVLALPAGAQNLRTFVAAGGRVLLLQAGGGLVKLFPDQIKSYRKTLGEIVTMQIPESPVFDGMDPLDTSWFEMGGRNLPYACSGSYEVDRSQPGVATLANESKLRPDNPPGAFFKNAGSPLVELRLGKGVILASEMMLSAKDRDPIAARLLRNLLNYPRRQ